MGQKKYVVVEFPYQLVLIKKGNFHFKYLYMHAYDWIKEYDWESYTGDDKVEEMYGEEHEPGPVRKIWIWWRLQKSDPIGVAKGSHYFRSFMNVTFLGFGIKNVDVVKDGKKISCQNGEINILIKPWIELDYGNKWANHPILKNFHTLYKERLIKNDIQKREVALLKEAYLFHGMLKKLLELYTFGDERGLYGEKQALEGL